MFFTEFLVFNTFQHTCKTFKNICFSACPSRALLHSVSLTRFNIFGVTWICYMLMRFSLECLLLKMKFVAYLVRLQAHTTLHYGLRGEINCCEFYLNCLFIDILLHCMKKLNFYILFCYFWKTFYNLMPNASFFVLDFLFIGLTFEFHAFSNKALNNLYKFITIFYCIIY